MRSKEQFDREMDDLRRQVGAQALDKIRDLQTSLPGRATARGVFNQAKKQAGGEHLPLDWNDLTADQKKVGLGSMPRTPNSASSHSLVITCHHVVQEFQDKAKKAQKRRQR